MASDHPTPDLATHPADPYGAPRIIYILYLVGIVIPLVALAGLVYAYIAKGKDAGADTHLSFQIRMFWWGLLIMILGGALSVLLVGYLLLLAWVVWILTRCITGLQLANERRPISEIGTMGFVAR